MLQIQKTRYFSGGNFSLNSNFSIEFTFKGTGKVLVRFLFLRETGFTGDKYAPLITMEKADSPGLLIALSSLCRWGRNALTSL
jgi:hypothetical protein